jgi:hypothetical protein
MLYPRNFFREKKSSLNISLVLLFQILLPTSAAAILYSRNKYKEYYTTKSSIGCHTSAPTLSEIPILANRRLLLIQAELHQLMNNNISFPK